eukprot:m51a1_g14454 putative C-tail anchored protein (505) ;mRNA; f:631857-633880
MYYALLVVALTAGALGQQCVDSPLDGQSLANNGYPSLLVGWAGRSLSFTVSMPQANLTHPLAFLRAPSVAWAVLDGARRPTLAIPPMTGAGCLLSTTATANVTALLAGGSWNKTVDNDWSYYHFGIDVVWNDAVFMYNPQTGLNRSTALITNRTSEDRLFFDLRVTRRVIATTNITFWSPVTLYAITRRLEVEFDPLRLYVEAEVHIPSSYVLQRPVAIASPTGPITGAGNVTISSRADAAWLIYTLGFTLYLQPGTCTFTGNPGSFLINAVITNSAVANQTMPLPLRVSFVDSEDWCPSNATAVSATGSQALYSSPAMLSPATSFLQGDTAYVGARISFAPFALRFTASVASAVAYVAGSSTRANLTGVATVACNASSSLSICWRFTLDPLVFPAASTYTVEVTYGIAVVSGRKREALALQQQQRLSLASAMVAHRRPGDDSGRKGGADAGAGDAGAPGYMYAVLAVLAGVAVAALVVAVVAVGVTLAQRRRAHERLMDHEDL